MTKRQIEKYLASRGWILHKCVGTGWNILNSDRTARQGFKTLSAISDHIQDIQLPPTGLKTVLDLYDAGKSDLTDIALTMLEEAGMSDPVQSKRATDIINRDCNVVYEIEEGNERIYRAEYADENFEIIRCNDDVSALQEAWCYEHENGHGSLFNLFEVDENYEDLRTIL